MASTLDNFSIEAVIEGGGRIEEIIDTYSELEIGVKCGLAGCGTLHKKGYIVKYIDPSSDEKIGVIGHICGRKGFGVEWDRSVKIHEKKINTEKLNQKFSDIIRFCKEINESVKLIATIADEINEFRRKFADEFPKLLLFISKELRVGNHVTWYSDDNMREPVHLSDSQFWTKTLESARPAKRLNADVSLFLKHIEDESATPEKVMNYVRRIGDVKSRFSVALQDVKSDLACLQVDNIKKLLDGVYSDEAHGRRRIRIHSCSVFYATSYSADEHIIYDLKKFVRYASDVESILRDHVGLR